MDLENELKSEVAKTLSRRHFLNKSSCLLGSLALGSLLTKDLAATDAIKIDRLKPLAPRFSHFAAKAKRVIYLHMAGSPSQLDLFDYKPELVKWDGKPCPKELLKGKRFAFIKGTPQMLGPQFKFKPAGESGTMVSELLPHFSNVIDDVTLIKSMHTEQFNHAPAQLMMHTGFPRFGRPSLGAWVTYGLGSANQNLPGFVVMVSGGATPSAGKSIWGSGFLPSIFQGVPMRSKGDPVLYVSNPKGIKTSTRKRTIEALNKLNQIQYEEVKDPEIQTRMAQYELSFRMQMSVPGVMDINKEPDYIHKMYGTEPGKASFSNNCLLARRLLEKGVRFVQLYHWGWDHHGSNKREDIPSGLPRACKQVDQPMAALISDLKQRGLLEDTLIIWGGEFGRTPMRENRGGRYGKYVGRDHHKHCFSMWVAGGGFKSGYVHGETDDIGYYITKNPVDVNSFQATLLNQLGFDHEKFTFPHQGRDYRLTDISGTVLTDLLA